MPLAATLNTNEVKNAAGTEIEFGSWDSEGRSRIFAVINEPPNLEHRLSVKHAESGSGSDEVRRSVARVDKTVTGVSGKPRVISAYKVVVIPTGDIANYDEVKNVSAELDSFLCTTGAGTTVLFDGSGNGDSALINGTL